LDLVVVNVFLNELFYVAQALQVSMSTTRNVCDIASPNPPSCFAVFIFKPELDYEGMQCGLG
jgi:hypothetical protein